MTLRTNIMDGDLQGDHSDQHNEVNAAVLALQHGTSGTAPADLPRAYYDHTMDVNPTTFTPLVWAHSSGGNLLDLTAANHPLLIAGGLVAVSTNITCPAQAGKHCIYELDLDEDGEDAFDEWLMPLDDPIPLSPGGISRGPKKTAYVPAGGKFTAYVKHDADAPVPFRFQAWVQYIAQDP